MGSEIFMLSCILFFFWVSFKTTESSSSMEQVLCHEEESSALLQFKHSFSINNSACTQPSAYAKTESWKFRGEGKDCCRWDGVECHNITGHVTGLDLTNSCLYGSINSDSSLFHLLHLQSLNLANNDFNRSQIPAAIGRLSRLTQLNLSLSQFHGQIPAQVLNLNRLVSLDLSRNPLKLPKLVLKNLADNLTHLQELKLNFVDISSLVPDSLANLSALTILSLAECGLFGEFPPAIFHLPNLGMLNVHTNPDLTGAFPEFNRSSPIQVIVVGETRFSGKLPYSIGNLNSLNTLDIFNCFFTGSIPNSLANLTRLTTLSLQRNKLQGPFPNSVFELVNLEALDLASNNLSGTVELGMMLQKLQNITWLQLSDNSLSVLTNTISNAAHPKLNILGLASCNLSKLPDFLLYQKGLKAIDLSFNNIHGPIPQWLPWDRLKDLSLRNNKLQGSVPSFLCNFTSLRALDLSYNNLSGAIPRCFRTFSNSLLLLNLRSNKIHGPIPGAFKNGCSLKIIDLSQNQLQGLLPSSLSNCRMLEILNLGNNHINDSFPSWLGSLPELKILILGSNNFHGTIETAKSNFRRLPKLCIIDISYNSFTGSLPSNYFARWRAMRITYVGKLRYMQIDIDFGIVEKIHWEERYIYAEQMRNRGMEMWYEKIPDVLKYIDFSNNQFKGEIPESIENLKGLHILNLSNNNFTGHIPPSLGTLTELESLDLSCNKLSGEIPEELSQLTFLAFFNVSYNNLTGSIPQGKQFNTFFNKSFFEGNPELCGSPLLKSCEITPPPFLTSFEEGPESWFEFDWKIVMMGYGSGVVIGVVIGHTITTRNHEWFMKTFGERHHKERRKKRRD